MQYNSLVRRKEILGYDTIWMMLDTVILVMQASQKRTHTDCTVKIIVTERSVAPACARMQNGIYCFIGTEFHF